MLRGSRWRDRHRRARSAADAPGSSASARTADDGRADHGATPHQPARLSTFPRPAALCPRRERVRGVRRHVRPDLEHDLGVPAERHAPGGPRQRRPSTNTATRVPAGAENEASRRGDSGWPQARNSPPRAARSRAHQHQPRRVERHQVAVAAGARDPPGEECAAGACRSRRPPSPRGWRRTPRRARRRAVRAGGGSGRYRTASPADGSARPGRSGGPPRRARAESRRYAAARRRWRRDTASPPAATSPPRRAHGASAALTSSSQAVVVLAASLVTRLAGLRRGSAVGQAEHEQQQPRAVPRHSDRRGSRDERRQRDQHEAVQERRDQLRALPERDERDHEAREVPRCRNSTREKPPGDEREDRRELDQLETETVGRP